MDVLIEIGAGVTGFRAWHHMKGKTRTDRVLMLDYRTGTPQSDRHYGVLTNFHRAIKMIKMDVTLSGVLPEFIDLRMVTKNEGVINALKVGKCKSMILGTLLDDILGAAKGFKSFAVTLPPQ